MENEQVPVVNDEAAGTDPGTAPKKATRTRRKAAPKSDDGLTPNGVPGTEGTATEAMGAEATGTDAASTDVASTGASVAAGEST